MPEQLEERVAFLEAEVERLKVKIDSPLSSQPWWEKIAGTFSEDSAYDEAMKLGREYRESQLNNYCAIPVIEFDLDAVREFNRLRKVYPRLGNTVRLRVFN